LQETDEAKFGGQQNSISGPVSGVFPSSTGGQKLVINANRELLEVFGGEEKIQFHQLMEKLNEHLTDVDPLVFEFQIGGSDLFALPSYGEGNTIQRFHHKYIVECFSST
jgi:hypothetical protein